MEKIYGYQWHRTFAVDRWRYYGITKVHIVSFISGYFEQSVTSPTSAKRVDQNPIFEVAGVGAPTDQLCGMITFVSAPKTDINSYTIWIRTMSYDSKISYYLTIPNTFNTSGTRSRWDLNDSRGECLFYSIWTHSNLEINRKFNSPIFRPSKIINQSYNPI